MDSLYFAYLFRVDEHLGFLHFLPIVNNAAMNIHVQAFLWMLCFNFSLADSCLGVEKFRHFGSSLPVGELGF
jgi:hypothetical protein